MPTPSCNGFESAIARAFRSATEEQICLVATVRLVTPQFLKVRALRWHLPFRAGIGLPLVPRAACLAAARGAVLQQPLHGHVEQHRWPVRRVGKWERTALCLGVGDDLSMCFGMTRYKVGAAFEKRRLCDGVSRSRQPRSTSTRWPAKPLEKLQPLKKYVPLFLCVRRPPASWNAVNTTFHRLFLLVCKCPVAQCGGDKGNDRRCFLLKRPLASSVWGWTWCCHPSSDTNIYKKLGDFVYRLQDEALGLFILALKFSPE